MLLYRWLYTALQLSYTELLLRRNRELLAVP